MRLPLLMLLFMLPALSTTHAADVPQASQRDNRIQYVNYHPGDVVVVHAMVGIASRIVFEQGETILSIQSGFTAGWDLVASGRILTLQPVSVKLNEDTTLRPDPQQWGTNVAVETDKRLYDFEVRLLPEGYKGKNAQVFYRIEFNYPIEAETQARAIAARMLAEQASDEQLAMPVPRNTNYTMRLGKRSEDIAPTMAFDDGRFTYLRFPNNRDFPAVFITTADGQEGKINSHVHEQRRDILVVHRVARELILRLGKSVVAIENQAFDLDGLPPVNGTTVKGLKRLTREVQP